LQSALLWRILEIGGDRYDKFSRNTAGQLPPVKAGQKFGKVIINPELVDNANVDDKENGRWQKAEMLIPIISVSSGKVSDQIQSTI
jgi:hypothetical protein